MRAGDVDDRTSLGVRTVCGEVNDVSKIEGRSIQTSGEIVEILLAIHIHADADVVRALDIRKDVVPVPIVVDPAGGSPRRKAAAEAARVGVWQVWEIARCGRLVAFRADIGHACFVQQIGGESVDVIHLVIPVLVRADIGKRRTGVRHAALRRVAKEAVKEFVVAVVKIMIQANVSLESIVDR